MDCPGGANWDAGGQFGGCLAFDNDTAVNPPSDVLSDISEAITISVWLDGYREGEDNWVFDTGAGDFFLSAIVPNSSGNVYFRPGDDANNALTWYDSKPADWGGSWNHHAFVKDENADIMRIYHNGVVVAEKTGTTNSLVNVRNTMFDIGAKLDMDNDYIGKMDDFRIYDYAMSAAEIITRRSEVPVIGCGSGPGCDGQILIAPDILGQTQGVGPKFAKSYGNLADATIEAFGRYAEEVQAGRYPDREHSYHMKKGELERLEELLKGKL